MFSNQFRLQPNSETFRFLKKKYKHHRSRICFRCDCYEYCYIYCYLNYPRNPFIYFDILNLNIKIMKIKYVVERYI